MQRDYCELYLWNYGFIQWIWKLVHKKLNWISEDISYIYIISTHFMSTDTTAV
jgi:hypothetical protein